MDVIELVIALSSKIKSLELERDCLEFNNKELKKEIEKLKEQVKESF